MLILNLYDYSGTVGWVVLALFERSYKRILYYRFDSSLGDLKFGDERIHISTAVHSRYIYGLGEHQKKFLIDTGQNHNYVFWAKGGSAKVTT